MVILHNIRSAENVGAMFRTCDAAGVDKIYLTGYTPAPIDRFGRKRKDIAKSALGAEEYVGWEQKKSLPALIANLKKRNYQIVAIEQDEDSINYRRVKLQKKNAFIVGAEVTGIPKSILKLCDVVAEIPMRGKKESLNVAVAFGIVAFYLLK